MGIESAIVGGLISGVGSLVGSSMTNEANRNIASENNATAIELANTAHQREVADLKAAGLNPILSANHGAATPSLTSPTMTNALGDAMSAGISNYSALQTSRQIDVQIDKTKTEANLNRALSAKAAADTTSALAQARSIHADVLAKTSSPFLSKIIGSEHSSMLSNAIDSVGNKLKSVIDGIHVNSASKAASQVPQVPASALYPKGMVPSAYPHDGSVEHLLQ